MQLPRITSRVGQTLLESGSNYVSQLDTDLQENEALKENICIGKSGFVGNLEGCVCVISFSFDTHIGCEIWGCRCGAYEYCSLLKCDTVESGRPLQTILKNLLSQYTGQKSRMQNY